MKKILSQEKSILKRKFSRTIWNLIILTIGLGLTPKYSLAITKDVEGKTSSGLNDSELTAQELGILVEDGALNIRGFIDSSNTNDVDFYQFMIDGTTSLDVFLDIDRTSDVGSSSDLDTGLDSMLWVFNNAGALIAENDDNDFFDFNSPEPGSAPFGDSDSFIGSLSLNPGTYFAAVSAFANEPSALSQPDLTFFPLTLSGNFVSNAFFDTTFDNANDDLSSFGGYQLQIRTQEEDVPIPEYSSPLGILVFGVLGISLVLKKKSKHNPVNCHVFKSGRN